jgi:D-3-phosphoglycerate dehydrogenase
VFVINTSRASLIDEDAAIGALDDGIWAGLATDVYRTEPPEDYKLVLHERVIATPHLGGYTEEGVDRATLAAVENIICILK